MRNHPLTPMRDASLVRVLARQSRNAVGLVPFAVVENGPDAIRAALHAEAAAGRRLIVTDALSDALERRGAHSDSTAHLVVEVTLIDAQPNKPTFKQLGDTPGLDYFSSVSIGGAELNAILRGPDGEIVTEVSHRRFSYAIDDINLAGGSWSEARRAVRQFATRVARAYVGQMTTITTE